MYFFFSSRRRHTILQGDWSSDVCSSDLEPEPAHPQEQLDERELPRLPAERPLGMTHEELRRPDLRGRRGRRPVLQPSEDVAHTDQDDDRLDAWVTWEQPLEDDIDSLRPSARAGDASHMHLGGPQTLEALRRLEHALEGTGPARVLVQQVAFRLTPAGDECSVECGARAQARYLASPLAVAVDFQPPPRP